MENNKLLIGVQFTNEVSTGKFEHYNIELFVPRDIMLSQLLEGIKYGLKKCVEKGVKNSDVYEQCRGVFSQTISKTAVDENGRQYLTHVTFTSFDFNKADGVIKKGDRCTFYVDELVRPICELGFITSSRIIFDLSGHFQAQGMLDTLNLIDAFNPNKSDSIFFPEYNISTRQLYRFDEKTVEIIDPTEPPKKNNNSLFSMLLPSIVSIGVLLAIRVVMMSASGSSSITMIILSIAMGITAVITTSISWKRQKKVYSDDLKDWRNQYADYIDNLIKEIKVRQEKDAKKLNELYPDVTSLINPDENGVYSLNERLYSRSENDDDFLTFRLGNSNDVESIFQIKGNDKNVVFSSSYFDIVTDNSQNDRLRLFLREELRGKKREGKENLCKLPITISQKYGRLKNAPLLYSLNTKKSLGIVDYHIDEDMSYGQHLISRMVFELCYYHSPEDLQFVVFFKEKNQWSDIENTINKYKFMPHFRDLFDDKSQFVFDGESANLVLSNLLTIVGNRKNNLNSGAVDKKPRIVMLVFEEHGLKEHAFAEFLPKVPNSNESIDNEIGLTFVFAKKYKEYLPTYCDDVISVEGNTIQLTPHSNINLAKKFFYDNGAISNWQSFYGDYTRKLARAFRFLASIYYAKIAQNGKVPSNVGAFELFNEDNDNLKNVVKKNWGIGCNREQMGVTKTLSVPIGKTETGLSFLDLHEKGDGPHMLVAGTTGSGKTETVITYLIGLCMHYRPDELNLLLVDMKGGGFTKRIGHLPHVVGAVTDVDGDENGTGVEYMLGRFLYAMKAEIKRRKVLFNKLYVDNIDSYIEACNNVEEHIKQKKVHRDAANELRELARNCKLSHLVLVVDEFTELKRFSNENNDIDFMGEITTIARVGRSLGFHIILISQNIEGAITEDIRVNSRARLCLKVATRQASKDMIGTDLAASPYMPGNGRAYLLVGTGSKFEYFQSGYSGAGTEESIPVEITLANKCGLYATFYNSDKDNEKIIKKRSEMKVSGNAKTQLEAMTEAICNTYANNRREVCEPHLVFRTPLPTNVYMDSNHRIVDISKKGDK